MPIPVSLTAIVMPPSAAVAARPTRPPSGVNFTAFDRRFSRICLTFRSSATMSPSRSSTVWVSVIPCRVARPRTRVSALSRAVGRWNRPSSSSSRPASTLDRSRMSLIRERRCRPDDRMSWRYSACFSFTSPNIRSANTSEKPRSQLTGALETLSIAAPEELPALQMRPAQARVGGGVVGIQIERPHEQPSCLGIGLARRALALLVAAEHEIVRFEDTRWRPADTALLGLGDLDRQRSDDVLGDLVLQREDVSHFAVVALGPDVIAGCRIHELGRDPHAIGGALDAAFEHVTHAQLAADVADLHGLALVREDRVAGDHEEPGDLRQRGDE